MSAAPLPRVMRKQPCVEGAHAVRAHRRDVENSILKRTACQVYGALCDCLDHSRYTGLAWPKCETLARRLHVTVRTVQRGLEELVAAGWIGTPCGDAGGSRDGILYHLHPDGEPCLFCVAAARTLNQRGKQSDQSTTGDKMTPQNTTGDNLSSLESGLKSKDLSSTGDKVSPVSTHTGDIFAARGDKNDRAYKERRFLTNSSNSPSTATGDFPAEFAEQMDAEIQLDRGALLRLWRTSREILPDATAEEIRHFFHRRAVVVYRNRKVENPTGLMLSTIGDWFEPRRVCERRREIERAADEFETLKRELSAMGMECPGNKQTKTACLEIDDSTHRLVEEIAARKGVR